MNGILGVGLVALLVAVAEGWPSLYDNAFKRWSLSRRSYQCQETGGKCYSTSDCCQSYVCAAIDEFGMNPTTPGWCVHEKELEPCVSNIDCKPGKCEVLGNGRYCVPRPAMLRTGVSNNNLGGAGKGGLGASCSDDSQCQGYSSSGDKLCCQRVTMGRQGIKKRCDRVTAISVCIVQKK